MLAANDSGPLQMWQYNTPNHWTDITTGSGLKPSNLSASVSADNRLFVVASKLGGPYYTWIYNGTPGSWSQVK